MACGHTDDVPNAVAPEVPPTPESSAVLHDIKVLARISNLYIRGIRYNRN
ncbi:MAG: hypothetical protein ACKVH8_03865 [Pirellulales bacterium]